MNLETLKITPNTDNIDIEQKCLGLCTNETGTVTNNRGLHIQIRHNGYGPAFRKANEISKLIAAAPDLYSCLESFRLNWPQFQNDQEVNGADLVSWLSEQWPYWEQALVRASGREKTEYIVKVKRLIPIKELDHDDLRRKPWGTYKIMAYSKSDALDAFHWDNPISCLEDFRITVEEA